MGGGEAEVAKRGEVSDDGHPADPAGEILEADGSAEAPIGVARLGEGGEAEIGDRHQDEADQHRPFHAQLGIEHAADEDSDQIGPEADPDVVKGDLVVAEFEIVEQQAEGELPQRVADLVEQDEEEDEEGTAPPEKFEKRTPDGGEGLADAASRLGFPVALRLAHHQPGEHPRKREGGAGGIADPPAVAGRQDQSERAGRDRTDSPAILRHAGADAELARLEQFDPVGVDDDVEGRSGDSDQDRGISGVEEAGGRIDERQVQHRRDHHDACDEQPRDALA